MVHQMSILLSSCWLAEQLFINLNSEKVYISLCLCGSFQSINSKSIFAATSTIKAKFH